MAEGPDSKENESHEDEAVNYFKNRKRRSTRGQRFSIDDGACRINRIDQLNEKIATLSSWLDDFSPSNLYSGLVLTKKTSNNLLMKTAVRNSMEIDNGGSYGSSTTVESKPSIKNLSPAESKKDLEQFAGIYSMKMVFASPTGNFARVESVPRVKKVHSQSFGSGSKKPMLVELHSFPGFDVDMITPLPPPLKPNDIIQIVISAQLRLRSKPTFKREFEKFVYSDFSQAIFSDTFWWFFCEKYQPTPASQEQLFNRIAHNYTKLLIGWSGSRYQDVFFKYYPDLLAQCVYATFCQAFPTSYRQFHDMFKDDLIYLVNQWITGTRPAPRTFEKWNLSELEPKDMRKGDQLYLGSSGISNNFDFDVHMNSKPLRSQIKPASAKHDDSTENIVVTKGRKISRVSVRPATRQGTFQLPTVKESEYVVGSSPEGQVSPRMNVEKDAGGKTNGGNAAKLQGRVSMHLMPKTARKKESCKAGRGPEFCKSVFDVYGKSPLIDQYLRSNNSASECGTGVLVRRTEIKRLPSLNALSYDEIIKGTQQSSRTLKKRYRRSMDESSNERLKISKKQMVIQKEMDRKTEELMSNPNLVKKISDILLLSLLRDEPGDIDSLPQDVTGDLAKALQIAQVNQP